MSDQNFIQFSKSFNNAIYFYGSILIVPIGTVLNIIQLIIYATSKSFKHGNIGFLLSLYVSIETLALFYSFVVFRYLPNSGFNIMLESNFACFTFVFFGRTIQIIPFYIQIYVSFVNYLKVKYPFKYLFLRKKRNLFSACSIVVAVVCFLNIPNLFYYIESTGINKTSNTSVTLTCTNSHFMSVFANVTNIIIRCILPACLMIVIDRLISHTLFKSKKQLKKHDRLEKERKFANILILLDIVFIIFNLPISSAELIITIYSKILEYPNNTSTMAAVRVFFSTVNTFGYTFYFVPFFLNLFCNKLFRHELFKLIRLKTLCTNSVDTFESKSSSQITSKANKIALVKMSNAKTSKISKQ